ncbi:Sas10/Utp3/C1D family protein, partial [Opisthorchis viverrini]|uniref:Nuclear nucleic acid-binding protein C1D n=2 Tax=Opisthorchis viverrini TaxID=6198 RepID=A0A074ZMW6_OPIVI
MAENSIFDEIPEEISQHLVTFSESIDDVDSYIKDFLASKNSRTEISNLEQIKEELSLCYAFNALFFGKCSFRQDHFSVYLRCNGVDTCNHPIMQELNRVMTALKRCRMLTEKESNSRLKCDKEAASRFIKHALWQSAHSKAKKRRPNQEGGTPR